MTDHCLICETEPIERKGWIYDQETTEAICPWCIKDAMTLKDVIKDVPMMVTHEELVTFVRGMFK